MRALRRAEIVLSRLGAPGARQPSSCPAGTGAAVPEGWLRDSTSKGSVPRKGLDSAPTTVPRRRSLGPGPPTPQLAPGTAAAPAPPSGPGEEGPAQALAEFPRPALPPRDEEMPQAPAPADEAAGEAGRAAGSVGAPAQPQALASPAAAAAGAAGAVQQLAALSPLLDLAGLAATPPRPPKGAPFEGEAQVPPPAAGAAGDAALAAWGAALPGPDQAGERQTAAGAHMATPLQAGGRAGEAGGAAAGGDGGLTPISAMWASSVLASGGARPFFKATGGHIKAH